MVAFSRLQLAAALLEYDNDPDDPSPSKSAEESAIFSHIRSRDGPRSRTLTGFDNLRETPNLLGVDLPNDSVSTRDSIDARRSIANTVRTSRASMDMLRNPFGVDDIAEVESQREEEDEDYQEEELEVDLEAWGMADYLGNKEKEKEIARKARAERRARRLSKAQSEMLSSSRPMSAGADEFGRLGPSGHLPHGYRSKSIAGMEGLPEDIQAIRGNLVATEGDFRRRTLSGPLDIMGRQTPDFVKQRSAAAPIHPMHHNDISLTKSAGPPSLQVPFPTSHPEQDEDFRSTFEATFGAPTSRFDPKYSHIRTISNDTLGSGVMLGRSPPQQSAFAEDDDGIGTISDRASRFDSRPSRDTRRLSKVSIGGTLGGTPAFGDDNPFSLPPPSPTRTSRFDPKIMAMTHTRTVSDASLGSRLPPDFDRMSLASGRVLDETQKPRPFSRLDLLRPKVLIMPSPLQELEAASTPPPQDVPAGFQISPVGLPLPPGAKSNRPKSQFPLPTGGSSLLPNPRLSLSLAQLTFRNSLMAGGQRDPSFADIEQGLRRAEQDGEQIYPDEDIEEEIAQEQKQAQGKAPGKLYGRSLMDELEARKEKMKSKQRVFTGDQRPSMMSRGRIRRSSTLIDPNTLQERPSSQAFNNNSKRPDLNRMPSTRSRPLLNFENETSPVDHRNVKSVFGVDQLWEREVAKVKEMEALEKAEEEERRKKEEKKAKKKAKKGKQKESEIRSQTVPQLQPGFEEPAPRTSRLPELPPTLPDIPKATARRAPKPIDYDSETDSEASEIEAKVKFAQQKSDPGGWASSDEEDKLKLNQKVNKPGSDESEDDVPLAHVLHNPSIRAPSPDSEDGQPLAKVLERKSAFVSTINFDNLHVSKNTSPAPVNEDEDDTPLGIKHPRASAFLSQSIAADDEDDDHPLALKQMQGRQSLYSFMPQQPMMMQPQMTGSIGFTGPSMMGGFSPFVMGMPAFNVAPPQSVADSAKFASVDRWRRDVAAE